MFNFPKFPKAGHVLRFTAHEFLLVMFRRLCGSSNLIHAINMLQPFLLGILTCRNIFCVDRTGAHAVIQSKTESNRRVFMYALVGYSVALSCMKEPSTENFNFRLTTHQLIWGGVFQAWPWNIEIQSECRDGVQGTIRAEEKKFGSSQRTDGI